ncbi:MAG: hypothetical protein ACYTXY_48030, partial [Nostoc sp.]
MLIYLFGQDWGYKQQIFNFISCWNQERSPLTSSIELLMRLLIIGSFGSVVIAGYSSFVGRYFQIINKKLKIIYSSIYFV